MAYQNHKHHHNRNEYGWWSPSNEYQYETTPEPAHTRHHHHKGQVAFYEDPIEEAYPKVVREPSESETITERFQHARFGDHNVAFESVDQEADAFIQYEHKRMEMAKLMSMRATH